MEERELQRHPTENETVSPTTPQMTSAEGKRKEVKEQEGGARARKGGGERERQEGEEHRKGQATA